MSRPENLLLESDNRTLKLLDFGESRVLSRGGDQDLTGFEPEISDLEFQAPELVSGGPLGTYTDMWAFGVLLYVLLRYLIPLQTFIINVHKIIEERFNVSSINHKHFVQNRFLMNQIMSLDTNIDERFTWPL